jgi:hypothetical protein
LQPRPSRVRHCSPSAGPSSAASRCQSRASRQVVPIRAGTQVALTMQVQATTRAALTIQVVPRQAAPTTAVAPTTGLKFGLLPHRRPQLRRSHTIGLKFGLHVTTQVVPPLLVAPTTGLKFGEAGLTTQVAPTMQVEATTQALIAAGERFTLGLRQARSGYQAGFSLGQAGLAHAGLLIRRRLLPVHR